MALNIKSRATFLNIDFSLSIVGLFFAVLPTLSFSQYQYDLNGNMSVRNGDALIYDGRDLLTSIGGDSQFEYDHSGSRVKKTYQGNSTIYFGDSIEIQRCKETNVFGFAGYPIASTSSNGTEWLHSNHIGSVVAVTKTDGSIYAQQYSTYGLPAQALKSPLGFNAQRHDESGLIYLHARYYDPSIGRFLTPDPISNTSHPSGLDPYEYAHNNPIMKADPTGLSPLFIQCTESQEGFLFIVSCVGTTADATSKSEFRELQNKVN